MIKINIWEEQQRPKDDNQDNQLQVPLFEGERIFLLV
jgi:hypothetical protein